MEKQLEFKFKGSRNYVQGPDIFNAISQEFEAQSSCWIKQIRFNSLLKNHAKLLIGSDVQNYGKEILAASGVATAVSNTDFPFALLPLNSASIHERYDYNEQEVIDNLSLNRQDKSIDLVAKTSYSLIEEAVAAVKELNKRLIPPPANNKWLFTGIKLHKRLPDRRSSETLQIIRRQIIASRFSRNELYLDSKYFGLVEFTLQNL